MFNFTRYLEKKSREKKVIANKSPDARFPQFPKCMESQESKSIKMKIIIYFPSVDLAGILSTEDAVKLQYTVPCYIAKYWSSNLFKLSAVASY